MPDSSAWHEIDPRDALRTLGYAEPADLKPVLGGWDTAIWRFGSGDGCHHALRVFRGPDWAEPATRERAALEAAAAAGLPVPAVEAFGQWRDLPTMVISWCPGEPLLQCIERRPWSMWRLSRLLGEVQARIHAVPPPEALRRGAPTYWLARAGHDAEACASALASAGVSSGSLIHGDYHPLNVLSDGRVITGIVDWTLAAAGDARADLAMTTAILQTAPVPPSPLSPLLKVARWLVYLAWRRGYQSVAGPIPDLAPFLVWAGAAFLNETVPRIGEAHVWGTEEDMEALRRWTARWRRRAGIG